MKNSNPQALFRIHITAATIAIFLIGTFQVSTLVSEIAMGPDEIRMVKKWILLTLPVLIAAIIAAGATGKALAGESKDPIILAKRARLRWIALNGAFVLAPAAIVLFLLSGKTPFGPEFYLLQVVEILAGLTNLSLLILNAQAGRLLNRNGR